jgi:two-component system LytT family response regulator
MKIRTLIVDDEPLARERIRSFLVSESDVEILGECGSGEEAVEAITKQKPDLVFLDVQMPGINGIEVLRSLDRSLMPVVIFVTAYDQHALAAFEVHALDYLLKPFKQTRFKEALQRAREHLENKNAGTLTQQLLDLLSDRKPETAHLTRLAVKTAERIVLLKTEQIDWLEAAGNYVVLHVGKQTHILRETLGSLEAKLDPDRFLRISRSALVNVEQIKELQPLFKGEYVVVLHNGQQLTMTRGIREVQELLKFS